MESMLSFKSALVVTILSGLLYSALFVKHPGPCITAWCPAQTLSCVLDTGCRDTLKCMVSCEGREDVSKCQFDCEMTLGRESAPFVSLLQCMSANDCFPDVPEDGRCLAGEEDTVQEIKELEQVAGDWWVVRGVNCGQDKVWLGGYDWYPCQHQRYLQLEDGGWINNTTYCGGAADQCSTYQIVTIPHATMPSPGLIRLEYDDEPLLPQVERWHIVARPSSQPEFMFVMWCGTNPALDYNGAFVLSRSKSQAGITKETEALFRKVATKHGVSYDEMCVSDNSACPHNP